MKNDLCKRCKRFAPMYLMMLPGFVYFFINNYMPMPGIILAFKKFKYSRGIWGSPWNGVKNFTFLISSRELSLILKNTLLYNALFIILGTMLSLSVAILLNEVTRKRLQKTLQTVVLIPHLLSYVIVSYIVYALFGAENGMINNSILSPLGMERISWYTEDQYWPAILTSVYLWKSFGFNSIIYFSTLVGFDHTLYEAAMVDGATSWKQIRYLTLPMLKPVVTTMTLFAIGRIMYSDFGLFYQVPMNSGMLYSTTTTIDTYVYRGLMEDNNIGRASAANFIQSILGFVLVLSANLAVRKYEAENALF